MNIQHLLDSISQKHEGRIQLNPPASSHDFDLFQKHVGFRLPADFVEFYSICNGFSCVEDLFQMKPLSEMYEYPSDYESDWIHFSDYMINSDMWTLRILDEHRYEILNWGLKGEIVLTNSLYGFLYRFLQGNVFEEGGLYAWQDEVYERTTE